MGDDTGPSRFDLPRRVLVPVDLSPLSYQAVDVARGLGGPECRIRVFHAVPSAEAMVVYGGDLALVPVYDQALAHQLIAKARREIAERIAGIQGPLDHEVVEARQPEEAIAQAAAHFGADLVVMTTHGRGGLSRLLSGSVAQKVLHAYHGPVLLLRPRRRSGNGPAA